MKLNLLTLYFALHLASASPTPSRTPKFGRFRMKDGVSLEFPTTANFASDVGTFTLVGEPVITYNASSGYVDGESVTYTYQTGPDTFEKVTTFVIEKPFDADDIDQIFYEHEKKQSTRLSTRTDISIPYNALDKRQLWDWVCHYTYGCVENVVLWVTISGAAAHSARVAFQNYLRRDNYHVLRVAAADIKQFAIGVASDQFSAFITNKVQQQNVNAINSCNNDELERKVQQLTDDLNYFMAEIRRMNGAKLNHFSENRKTEQDGENLAHTMRFTRDRNSYKNINNGGPGGC